MTFRNFIDKALFYISVPSCVHCGEKLNYGERALCSACMKKHVEHKMRNCSRCAKLLNKCSCTSSFLDTHYVHRMIKAYRYIADDVSPSNSIIYSQKRVRRSDVTELLADEIAEGIINCVQDCNKYVITSVPRRKKSIKKYGKDHAAALAKSVAKKLSAEYYPLLISKNKYDQKKLQGEARRRNIDFDYRKRIPDIKGRRVILIDDVVTTGASMGGAAMLIHGLGAKEIVGASVAIAYKDSYIRMSNDDRFYNSGKGKA